MQIIIEGYQYPAGAVDKVLWEGAFQTVDGKVSIGYVGYYWNDRLKDSVFGLPKVFLEPDANKQDLVFGKYKPEDVIDVANQKFTKAERDFIYGFAVWIYRTLSVFKVANPASDIILHEYVSQMGQGRRRVRLQGAAKAGSRILGRGVSVLVGFVERRAFARADSLSRQRRHVADAV